MNDRQLLIAMAAGLALLGIVLGLFRSPDRPGHSIHPTIPAPTAPSPRPASSPSAVAPAVTALLPFTQQQIADAVRVATRFLEAYASYRYDQSTRQYLDRLTPMVSPQLKLLIERDATNPATLRRRRQSHQVVTAHARAETIRTLGPTSITILVTASSHITSRHATRQETTRYAVTVLRHDDAWQIYAIELAATGDNGQASTGGVGT